MLENDQPEGPGVTRNVFLQQARMLSRQNGPGRPCPWQEERHFNVEPTEPAEAEFIGAEVQRLEGEIRAEVLKAAQAGRFFCSVRYSGYHAVIKALQQKAFFAGFSLRGQIDRWPGCFTGPFIAIEWQGTE
jgi:hypothetical protein